MAFAVTPRIEGAVARLGTAVRAFTPKPKKKSPQRGVAVPCGVDLAATATRFELGDF